MSLSRLISPAYQAEQQRLHAMPEGYGGKGRKWAPAVLEATTRLPVCHTILDYGCGQGSLLQELRRHVRGVQMAEYDPAIPGKDRTPSAAHLVVCTDVLEHVEPEKIEAVLDHLALLAVHGLFVVISLVETAKTLSDGRQAHILLKPVLWWRHEFERRGFWVEELENYEKPEKQWAALLTKAKKK